MKGEKGSAGERGPQGLQGPPGLPAVLAVSFMVHIRTSIISQQVQRSCNSDTAPEICLSFLRYIRVINNNTVVKKGGV